MYFTVFLDSTKRSLFLVYFSFLKMLKLIRYCLLVGRERQGRYSYSMCIFLFKKYGLLWESKNRKFKKKEFLREKNFNSHKKSENFRSRSQHKPLILLLFPLCEDHTGFIFKACSPLCL